MSTRLSVGARGQIQAIFERITVDNGSGDVRQNAQSPDNPRLKVLVVDPQPENIREKLYEKGIRCTPARQTFGEDIAYMHEVAKHILEAVRNEGVEQTTATAGTAP